MLVQRIQASNFADMAELAIDHLGGPLQKDGSRAKSSRRQPITSILEWVQCFANYTSVIAYKDFWYDGLSLSNPGHPHRI